MLPHWKFQRFAISEHLGSKSIEFEFIRICTHMWARAWILLAWTPGLSERHMNENAVCQDYAKGSPFEDMLPGGGKGGSSGCVSDLH